MDNSSLQSLRTALIPGVRWPDVLPDLLYDGEELGVLAGVEPRCTSDWCWVVSSSTRDHGHRLTVEVPEVLIQLLQCSSMLSCLETVSGLTLEL